MFYLRIPAERWKSKVVKDRAFWDFMHAEMSKVEGSQDQKFQAASEQFSIKFLK